MDNAQKAKVEWLIEGDENSKFFHGIINKKRYTPAIRGMMVNGEWVIDPNRVKKKFRKHFSHQFLKPRDSRCTLNFAFPKQLSAKQRDFLDSWVSREEIRKAVWDCGVNKSSGPDGFTVVADDIYSGITIGTSMKASHLFYADDVVFVGEWSRNNIQRVGVHPEEVMQAANLIGCLVLKLPFKYLGVMI
nr:RNA-directed DNA polymerase, eukaryota [Tanacetum cinerariifolium]